MLQHLDVMPEDMLLEMSNFLFPSRWKSVAEFPWEAIPEPAHRQAKLPPIPPLDKLEEAGALHEVKQLTLSGFNLDHITETLAAFPGLETLVLEGCDGAEGFSQPERPYLVICPHLASVRISL
jgi:hypothetical protein